MRKKKVMLMVLLLAVVAALGGCKGGTQNEEGEKTPTGETPVYGGSVVVGITQDMDSLDPHKAVAAGTKEVLYNIFEGLVKSDKDGNLVPAVAQDYTISEDGTVYSFELRDNARFHNGETVTANDVIYSLKRCAGMLETSDPEVQVISAFSIISEINVAENVVNVILSEPNTELIGYFTCAIIPEDYDNHNQQPVGTGPFKFVSYQPQVSVVMARNEDYYIEGVPYLDEVTFKIAASSDAAFLELLGGSIDVFPYLTDEQALQLGANYEILSAPMNMVQALFLNNSVAPFDDVRVRRAMCHAIDRQAIIDMVSGGRGDVVGSAMFAGFTQYYDETLKDVYQYDADKAKELLTEAGYGDGFTFTIKVPSNYTIHVNTAQIIADQLKKVGVNAEIKLVEWATWLTEIYNGRDFEATIVGLDAKLAPGDVLRFYPSTASRNFINFFSDEFDSLYEKAIATVDTDEKANYYKQLQSILTDNAASVFIQSPAQVVAVKKGVGGYTFYPIYTQDMSVVYKTE